MTSYPPEPWDLEGARLRLAVAGARELWGIPKEMADLTIEHDPTFTGAARAGGELIAKAAGTRGRGGPRLPFPLKATVLQTLRGVLARTSLRATGRVHSARVAWQFEGPLAWPRPYRSFLSVATTDFAPRFGPRLR